MRVMRQMTFAAALRMGLAWLFGSLAVLACIVTAVSTIRSNKGWIRILDFPRLLELLAIGLIAIGCATLLRRWRWPLLAGLSLAAAWQVWRIYPYIPHTGTEIVQADELAGIDPGSCFAVLGLNVLQSNRAYAAIALIKRERPDVLLLMETDQRWLVALAPVLRHYRYRLLRPLDNTYGMIFASNLPVQSARMVDITDHDTPTLYARLTTRTGRAFGYVGLHPRPPRPGQDTRRRDAKIERAALAISDDGRLPTIATGDFNDVSWSYTTQLFKRVGGFLDPRVGRGSYPTFPADHVTLGWPLDHLLMTPHFTFRRLRVLESVGSDHRPLAAQLCLPDNPPKGNKAIEAGSDVRAKARKAVEKLH